MSFSDFFDSEFVTLMNWVYVSFLPPSFQDLWANISFTLGPASPIFHSTKCPLLLLAFLNRRHYRINITLPTARSPQIKSGRAPGLWVTKTSFRNGENP